MRFRRKLLGMFALTVCLSVAAVAWLVSAVTRRAFDHTEDERTAELVAQFRREFSRQSDIVVRRVEVIAASEAANRMALALNRAPADSGPYFELAKAVAENSQLDFLEFAENNGTVISSAQWPAKFGYPEEAFSGFAALSKQAAFLKQETMPEGSALGLFSVRSTRLGERPVYVIGGRRLDKTFLAGLDMPAEMRVLLYQNRGARFAAEMLVSPAGSPPENRHSLEELEPLINAVQQSEEEKMSLVRWSEDAAEDELFHAIPLTGTGADRPMLAILLIGNSRRTYVELIRHIRTSALLAAGGGILLAILLSSWAASRVTRPVEQLASAAQQVAAGNWDVRVDVAGGDELAQMAASFNRMTSELQGQRERLLQAERVAAWRELARRLAHELKNPLFPLQLTVENVIRAKEQNPEQFDEVFQESSETLLAEITNLKEIIGKFSEFSKMPQPQLQPVELNEVARGVAQLFRAQFERAKIGCELQLDPHLQTVTVDAELLRRSISNLVLNAIDAMPEGGVLTLRTREQQANVIVEVSDTGAGMTPEECEMIFTPYYTSKQNGSGLGLAIVQSVVSDHGGRVRVHSERGQGTTFAIELPKRWDPVKLSSLPNDGDGRTVASKSTLADC